MTQVVVIECNTKRDGEIGTTALHHPGGNDVPASSCSPFHRHWFLFSGWKGETLNPVVSSSLDSCFSRTDHPLIMRYTGLGWLLKVSKGLNFVSVRTEALLEVFTYYFTGSIQGEFKWGSCLEDPNQGEEWSRAVNNLSGMLMWGSPQHARTTYWVVTFRYLWWNGFVLCSSSWFVCAGQTVRRHAASTGLPMLLCLMNGFDRVCVAMSIAAAWPEPMHCVWLGENHRYN